MFHTLLEVFISQLKTKTKKRAYGKRGEHLSQLFVLYAMKNYQITKNMNIST